QDFPVAVRAACPESGDNSTPVGHSVCFGILQNSKAMLTEVPPRKRNRALFLDSDRIKTLDLPQDARLQRIAMTLQAAMEAEATAEVRRACTEFLAPACDFYRVRACEVRVLAARPLRVREYSTTELFGDYHPDTML